MPVAALSAKFLLVLFVAGHLLIDLAMPSLPGAFRFNPDESVVGLRVQPVQAQDLEPIRQMDSLWGPFELPRLTMRTPVALERRVNAGDLIVFLPRRNPSSDRSPQGLTEDA